MRKLAILTALAAAAVYFLNSEHGARRRATARDRLLSLFGGRERTSEPAAPAVAVDDASGSAPQASSGEEERSQPDDVTLARMVESELFGDEDVPKGQINVNAENGKIVLRGEVEQQEMIAALEERTRKIRGVQEVENLLHVPGAPSSTHQ